MSDDLSCDSSAEPEVVLTILHFNDVYEIEARAEEPVGGAARWPERRLRLADCHKQADRIIGFGICPDWFCPEVF